MDGTERREPPLMDLQSLKALSLLGRGAKGIAFLVRNPTSPQENLALKVISKALIEKKKNKNKKKNSKTKTKESNDGDEDADALKRIWFERDVLKLFNHPLLPKLRGLAVTQDIVSFAIDYCPGGNLNSLRKQQTEKMFSEDLIRFYAAELVLAIEYLHGLGIIYRDLKPENILIQENGHLMLVDFDLSTKVSSSNPDQIHPTPSQSSRSTTAKKKNRFPTLLRRSSGISPVDSTESKPISSGRSRKPSSDPPAPADRSNSFVGTEEYVAPEIITGNGHGFAVDRWGLGVVMYEMLYGKTPFRGSNRSETFYRILVKEPELVGDRTALRDLIRKLLEKDPTKRISMEEIKGHGFFRGVDWNSVLSISRPPYIPAPTKWEEEEGEELEGIKGIDVELYVKEVCDGFDVADGEKNGGECDGNNKEANKDVWREGLDNNPNKNSDFFFTHFF